MTAMDIHLNYFMHTEIDIRYQDMMELFDQFGEFEISSRGIIRERKAMNCPDCGNHMTRNGSNKSTRKNVGNAKIGKWKCPSCNKHIQSEKKFWTSLKIELDSCLTDINSYCLNNGMSFRAVEGLADKLVPIFDESIRLKLKLHDERIPPQECDEDVFIIHYDEQHPKKGITQKYRLTLIDGRTRVPIADELYDDKSSETIKAFFRKHLDTSRRYFIVTDLGKNYPEIFKELFPNGYTHQFCI